MTEQEREEEWEVDYQTRLGAMCGAGKPSEQEASQAAEEATLHVFECELAEMRQP